MLKERVGSEAYMAPEMSISEGGYNYKVDIWNIGVIVALMLTGAHPFLHGALKPYQVEK